LHFCFSLFPRSYTVRPYYSFFHLFVLVLGSFHVYCFCFITVGVLVGILRVGLHLSWPFLLVCFDPPGKHAVLSHYSASTNPSALPLSASCVGHLRWHPLSFYFILILILPDLAPLVFHSI
jgi:hypothetical protein